MTSPARQNCVRSRCGYGSYRRGLCHKHYWAAWRAGRFGRRDPGPARDHVRKLRCLGWTYRQIAEAAGIADGVPHHVDAGVSVWLFPESEQAILSVPLEPRESRRGVDGTGTYRRYEALQWMGWPEAMIAAEVGVAVGSLSTMRKRGDRVSYRLARAMAELFERWSATLGPSRQTATKARKRGYASPWAWDDIDDPRARPSGVRQERTAVE